MSNENKILNEEGQALFEFVVFLPLLIYFFTVFVNVSNSINASINQQKATRGYAFHLVRQDSYIPSRSDLSQTYRPAGISFGSAYSIGWRVKEVGQSSAAACFKFSKMFGTGNEVEDQDCDELTERSEKTSQIIKVFTVFGLCGQTYQESNLNNFYEIDNYKVGLGSCQLN